MGVLDDAIREHLDLKRRRGADPTEVERAERDALGPVRRVPERVPGDDSELELESGAAPEPGEAPERTYENELDYRDEDVNAGQHGYADEPAGGLSAHALEHAPAAYDQAPTPEPAAPGQDEASWSYEGTEPEPPQPEPPAEPPHDHADHADHTVEYSVDAAIGAEPPRVTEPPGQARDVGADETGEHAAPSAADEDVLEETPEFLQDTPDHDRLWFEQRPPRDFDFDG